MTKDISMNQLNILKDKLHQHQLAFEIAIFKQVKKNLEEAEKQKRDRPTGEFAVELHYAKLGEWNERLVSVTVLKIKIK